MNLAQALGLAGGAASGIETATQADLRALNKALKENANAVMKGSVGYPQQGVQYTGEVAPLVPQSIQPTLDSATFTQKHIVFWPMLAKQAVSSTLHESTRVNEHGSMYLDPWIAEGEGGVNSEAEYERLIVKIKYLAERIELTDVATMVGIVGNQRNALAQRTVDGTLALMGKLERQLFLGDEDLTPNSFDGLFKQISAGAPDNVFDQAGVTPTVQNLQTYMTRLNAAPNFGTPTVCLVSPEQHTAFVNQASAAGRHDQVRGTGEAGLTFGKQNLFIQSHVGQVPIIPCPLMRPPETPNAASQGSNPPPALATFSPTLSAATTGGSRFKAADFGAYNYKIVGVGDEGVTAPFDFSAASVAVSASTGANSGVEIEIADTRATGDSTLRYYRVYRSPVDGGAGTETFMGQYPVNSLGTGTNTLITDLNDDRPKTNTIYILQLTPDVMYWAQLLDFMRRPLAQVKTTIPFLLMLFGALHVKVPTKCFALKNAGLEL